MKRPYRDSYEDPEKSKQALGWEDKLESYGRYAGDENTVVEQVRIPMDKRFVAFLIDVAVGWIIGLFVNFIPFVNMFIQAQTTMIFYLIVKDAFFDGHGVGKNLMGLQVVDIKSGKGASVIQSIQRNIVVFGPALLLYVVSAVLKVIPNDLVNTIVMNGVNTFGGLYTLAAIPYEAYRAYSRTDGKRWGDQLAGCTIIDAPMNFSQFLPR